MDRLYELVIFLFILLFGANYAFALSSSPFSSLHMISLVVSAVLGAFFYKFV